MGELADFLSGQIQAESAEKVSVKGGAHHRLNGCLSYWDWLVLKSVKKVF
jgi:hypothetical protein